MTFKAIVEKAFVEHFQEQASLVVKAPGRVNLIGEHTDYNDGFVFPCAIEFGTYIGVRKRNDNKVRVLAIDYQNQIDQFSLDQRIDALHDKTWANYIRGVVVELLNAGYEIPGFDMAITGNVPQGAGLSSSASLEVGVTQALSHLFELNISLIDSALISQAAENNFVGCACGIMDQLISACGQTNHSLLIDCRTLDVEPVSLPEDSAILMVNSNVKRGLVDSHYNERRQQCEAAAEAFSVPYLRDLSIEQFEAGKSTLEPMVAKRAEHVVYENQRTLDMKSACQQQDMVKIHQLMKESHHSMRDLFEITTPEIDALVGIISDVIGERGGVRMTGGGFGGCVVALIPKTLVTEVVQAVEDNYKKRSGLVADCYLSEPAQGVTLL